jgi:hypothetical protein
MANAAPLPHPPPNRGELAALVHALGPAHARVTAELLEG